MQIEKEKQTLKTKYELPTTPHVIVHPSPTAKGGKFSCSVATLSLLLDYRITDNKEHSFEVSVKIFCILELYFSITYTLNIHFFIFLRLKTLFTFITLNLCYDLSVPPKL